MRSLSTSTFVGLLLLTVGGHSTERVDAECLVVETLFAANLLQELESTEPMHPQWKALQQFRLAAAYIPARQRKEAVRAIRAGLKIVEHALAEDRDNVEILLLGAMLDGQFLLLRPWRYFWNGRRGMKRLARAEALDPLNPRIALIRGTAEFVLPTLFGGSTREAESWFEQGLESIRVAGTRFKLTALCQDGEWGQVDLMNWLARAQSKLGKEALAQRTFAAAAVLSPGNHWVEIAVKGEGYEWSRNQHR